MTEMGSMPNANESSIRIIPFENVHHNACREIFSRGLSNQGSTALIRALQKWFVGSKIDTEKGDMYDIGKFFMTGGKGTGEWNGCRVWGCFAEVLSCVLCPVISCMLHMH